jgi:hypothetical protein
MRIKVLFLLIMCSRMLNAQQVVATAGNLFSNENGSISYTIGEGVASTFSNGDKTLTQGFHQTGLSVIVVDEPLETDFLIEVFPNPATETVTIKTDKENVSGLQYFLFDQRGKLLIQKNLESSETTIPVEQFPEGFYIIKIQGNMKELKSFKIIKQ